MKYRKNIATVNPTDVTEINIQYISRHAKVEAIEEAKSELSAARAWRNAVENVSAEDAAQAHDAVLNAKAKLQFIRKLDDVTILNDGNPLDLGTVEEGYLFTVSPSTAKKGRGYYTDVPVPMTKYELKMPGVVVAQNRGMLFSSSRPVTGNYIIPELRDINLIVVDEVSRTLYPQDDEENKIAWKGNGEHTVKDVIADGQGQHWFARKDGKLATELWLKLAKLGYGLKGMLQPGLESDVGSVVVDHWGIERVITLGNTMLVNSSIVKGLGAYESLEDLIAHGEEWGLTTLQKQWQSGDHRPAERRIMGTQPNATNLALTMDEITEFLEPEALNIWAMKHEALAWMKHANIRTSRGRAIAARPSLLEKDLVMRQIDNKAGNDFLRLCQGKFMAEGQYLKMYEDQLVYSLVYVHGMNPNEAAKKAAETGLHGEIRVNPSFAGRYYKTDENGEKHVFFKKETHLDEKGRYIETALVRYPHGAPSETIIVKAYLDTDVPKDVIIFPAPIANNDNTIPVRLLYAMRLQGADFDGDAVTAFTEKKWIAAQKRNTGKEYMVIPVNTESTAKDKTLVTDETWELFCQQKVESLSNRVGLIATSLKYFMSQDAQLLRDGDQPEVAAKVIVDHACAMGDDIDEFKHGKAQNELPCFVVEWDDVEEILRSPYFNRYACKYKTQEDFNKVIFNKDGSLKTPGKGVLDMYAVAMESLMRKAKLPIISEITKATDGKDRYYFTVHPVQWQSKDIDLHIAKGEGHVSCSLPVELEELYGVEHGTLLTAKDLFLTLYRDHAATCKNLLGGDKDQIIKNLIRINERYALAKIAIVAWAKAMKAKRGEGELSAEEALKVFTTIMVQHQHNNNSTIDVLCRPGTFKRSDGSVYEKTLYSAQRCFNYFLDLCGDGLMLIGTEEPNFPAASEKAMAAVNAKAPDLDKAKELARKELTLIDELISKLGNGLSKVIDDIDRSYAPDFDEEFVGEEDMFFDSGDFELTDEELEFARQMAEDELDF